MAVFRLRVDVVGCRVKEASLEDCRRTGRRILREVMVTIVVNIE